MALSTTLTVQLIVNSIFLEINFNTKVCCITGLLHQNKKYAQKIQLKKISKKKLNNNFSGILKVSAGNLKENENCRLLRRDAKFV